MKEEDTNFYKISKYPYYEIFLDSQLQSAGAHQAKVLEKLRKNNKYIQNQTYVMKLVFGFIFSFFPLMSLISYFDIMNALNNPSISLELIIFVQTLLFCIYLSMNVLYLFLFGLFTTSAYSTGEAFNMLHTLPISKKNMRKIGFLTIFRSLNLPLIANIFAFPIIMLIATRNFFIFLICLGTSFPNAIFAFCILVLLGDKLGRIFNKRTSNSKKTNIYRIITMVGYFIIAFSTGFLLNLSYYLIDFFLDIFTNFPHFSILNTILSLIPFPFAPSYLITIVSIPNQVSSGLIMTSLIGFSIFLVIVWSMYRKAFRSLYSVTSTEITKRPTIEELPDVTEAIKKVQIQVKTPIKSYLKKDLTSLTRDYQSFMFFIMPIIWPVLMLIIMTLPITKEVTTNASIMILWGIILSLCIFIPLVLIIGLLNLEQSGESALASLPTLPRDQAKAKLILMSAIQSISFILISIVVTIQIQTPLFMLIYLSTLPIAWIFLFSMFEIKVALFGKMKYKYVLEEVYKEKKARKWILIFIIEIGLYVFIQTLAYFVFGLYGIIYTTFGLFLIGIFGLSIVIYIFNRMFPKIEDISSYQTGGILRKNPLLGIVVLLAIYFLWNFLPIYIEFPILFLIIQYIPYIGLLLIDFCFNFGLLAILWLFVIPTGLKLPTRTKNLKEYANVIGLTKYKPLTRNLFLSLTIPAIYFLSFFIGANLLGNYIFDLNVLFGNPNPNVSGFLGLGWFLFVIMLIPGIWEEISFRGVMLPMLQKKYRHSVSIILNGVIFGLFHATNLIPIILSNGNPFGVYNQMIYASFIGITLAYTRTKTQSLIPVIIIHYLIDSVGQLFLYVVIYDLLNASIFLIFFVGIIPSFISILLVRITFAKHIKRKAIKE